MTPWTTLTPVQIAALRAVEAAGESGLIARKNGSGSPSINGNCEYALKGGVAYPGAKREALIETRDHGHLRIMRSRYGSGVELRDLRHHLTPAGRAMLDGCGL